MQFISLADFLLLPFYLIIIYFFAYRLRNRWYPQGHAWRPYFVPALSVKIFGAIFIGLVYQYYYGGGDTAMYFLQAKVINSSMMDSPWKWLNLVLHIPKWYDGDYQIYISQMPYYPSLSTYAVCSVTAVINLFTFNTFLPSSIIMAFLAFSGFWAMFRTFALQYPKLTREVALATLFIPSCFVWGSGIFKDTLCMFGMGWLIFFIFKVLLQGRPKPSVILMGVLGFWLIWLIKIYILLALFPSIVLWLVIRYAHRIRNYWNRLAMKLLTLVLVFAALAVMSETLSDELGTYSLDQVVETSKITREDISRSTGADGSAYSLGEFEPGIAGLFKKMPAAVNVTLFRPYPWEAHNVISFMNSIESFIFMLIAIMILFKQGPLNIWRMISKDPNIQFFLVFAIIFAFAVGVSTFNFGTLSRYKIPCLPMFAMSLLLMYRSDPRSHTIAMNQPAASAAA